MAKSQLRLGTFSKDEGGALFGVTGGLGLGSTKVISLHDQSSDGRPFLKLIGDPMGAAYEIGILFPREKNGMNYYLGFLDSPLMPLPINVALFPDRENAQSYNMIWSRPEPTTSPAPQAQTAQHRTRSQAFLSTP